jgi:hypothetical protein
VNQPISPAHAQKLLWVEIEEALTHLENALELIDSAQIERTKLQALYDALMNLSTADQGFQHIQKPT